MQALGISTSGWPTAAAFLSKCVTPPAQSRAAARRDVARGGALSSTARCAATKAPLPAGEYIAVEKVEAVYKKSALVEQARRPPAHTVTDGVETKNVVRACLPAWSTVDGVNHPVLPRRVAVHGALLAWSLSGRPWHVIRFFVTCIL
jgi:hypothetical protein